MAEQRHLANATMLVSPDDATYREQARIEGAFWGRPHLFGIEAGEGRASPRDELGVGRYTNERFTGDPDVAWHESIAGYGPFGRALFLGTSGVEMEMAILEANAAMHVTFIDISAAAMERRERELGERFPGRVAAEVADLNFVELPAGAFDAVISASTLHHITNLEHLASQINRALAPGGYFFMQDYAGERRFAFSDAKKRVFETLRDRHRARASLPRSPAAWKDVDEILSPFCAVRSDETLTVLREHLVEEALRTAGTLLGPLMLVQPAVAAARMRMGGTARMLDELRRRLRVPPRSRAIRLERRYVEELLLVGDTLVDAGVLLPGNVFGIYRKKLGGEC